MSDVYANISIKGYNEQVVSFLFNNILFSDGEAFTIRFNFDNIIPTPKNDKDEYIEQYKEWREKHWGTSSSPIINEFKFRSGDSHEECCGTPDLYNFNFVKENDKYFSGFQHWTPGECHHWMDTAIHDKKQFMKDLYDFYNNDDNDTWGRCEVYIECTFENDIPIGIIKKWANDNDDEFECLEIRFGYWSPTGITGEIIINNEKGLRVEEYTTDDNPREYIECLLKQKGANLDIIINNMKEYITELCKDSDYKIKNDLRESISTLVHKMEGNPKELAKIYCSVVDLYNKKIEENNK